MASEVKDAKVMEATVERFESLPGEEMKGKGLTPPAAMGTVNLTDLQEIFLVPAPSADPRGMMSFDDTSNAKLTCYTDPLNLPKWRKVVFIVLLSICKQCDHFLKLSTNDSQVSSLGLSLVSGFGGLLAFYIPIYASAGATYEDITALMTFPSMFMGVGCLVGMPLALAIGRRPVYLGSLVILVVAAVLAAYAKDYTWHLGARMMLGFAAGQSEALVPMMIQVRQQQITVLIFD
jgi:hypothetical protein